MKQHNKINILSRFEFNKLFKTINEKTENQSYDFGCIMGYFDKGFKNPKIDKKDLYDNEEHEYGLEIEPHISVLYGLKDNEIEENDVIKLFSLIDGPEVSVSKISLFKNDKYDVVKWDVESEDLVILNKMVTSMFPYKSDFPDYHAHVTIAYCLPGKGKKYEEELKKPLYKKIDYWVYSKADGKKIKIIPGKEPEIIRNTKDNKVNESFEKLIYNMPTKLKDESFDYKGYRINLIPNARFNDDYSCSVYLNNEYKMGFRGPVSLEKGKEAAIYFVDGAIAKNE